MSDFITARAVRVARYSFLVCFLCSGLLLRAQATTPPSAAKPESLALPPSAGESSQILLFRIRSAFSLTPAMIQVLQTRSPEPGAMSGSASGSRSPAPASDPSKAVAWGEALERSLPFAAPLDVRLVGKNVVALIQIVPIELRSAIVDLIIQGQVWVKMPDDSLSFKTAVQVLSLPLGSRFYFYPLGVDTKTGAPIAVEIRVERQPKP